MNDDDVTGDRKANANQASSEATPLLSPESGSNSDSDSDGGSHAPSLERTASRSQFATHGTSSFPRLRRVPGVPVGEEFDGGGGDGNDDDDDDEAVHTTALTMAPTAINKVWSCRRVGVCVFAYRIS